MPLLSDFERFAWDNRSKADQHPIANALKAALDDMEAGTIKPKHVFVVFVEEADKHNDEEDRIGYYQSGDLPKLAIEGALHRAIHIHWQDS